MATHHAHHAQRTSSADSLSYKKMFRLVLVLLAVLVPLSSSRFVRAGSNLRRVCYYTNWAQYRPGAGKFFPESVDPTLCTHIIYAFAKLNGNHLMAFEWNDETTDWMKGMFDRFNALKARSPGLKTLLAVGGWNMGSAPFTSMVSTAASRHEFATSTVQFLRKRNFDGIDLDWEYPANRGSPAGDRQKFTELVRDVRRVFDEEAARTGRPALLVTAAVAAGKSKIDTAYDVPQLSRDLDFISLMTYDLHGSWETTTGHNSPLFARAGETGDDRTLNLDWAANYWVQKGAAKDKLNIGMGLYGRSFTLKNTNNYLPGADTSGKGTAGQYTREGGFISYYEVCKMKSEGGRVHYISDQKVPYIVHNNQWVGYDDADSLKTKVQYTLQHGYGGIMVWALDLDDFSGSCGQGKYPLLTAINEELGHTGPMVPITAPTFTEPHVTVHVTEPTHGGWTPDHVHTQPPWMDTTAPPVYSTHPPAGISNPNGDFSCSQTASGYYQNPTSCSEYFICAGGVAYKFHCASGLLWNSANSFCDWPDNVNCHLNPPNSNIAPTTVKAPSVPSHTLTQAVNTPVQTVPHWPVVTEPPTTQRVQNLLTAIFGSVPVVPTAPPPTPAPTHPPTPVTTVVRTSARTSATTPRQKTSKPGGFTCVPGAVGYFPSPTSCHEYYICANGMQFRFNCAHGLMWNTKYNICDRPESAKCQLYQPVIQATPSPKTPPRVPHVLSAQQPVPNPAPKPASRRTKQPQQPVPDPAPKPASRRTKQPSAVPEKPADPSPTFPSVLFSKLYQTELPPAWRTWTKAEARDFVMNALGPGHIDFCDNRVDGIYPDLKNCRKYIECTNKKTHRKNCPANLAFHPQHSVCDYPHNVPGC